MGSAKTLQRLDATRRSWQQRLEPLDESAFARAAPDGGWCVGQVCDHVGSVSTMLLENARRAAEGDGEQKGFQFQPWLLSVIGGLPPMRIKVPVEKLPKEMHVFAHPEPLTKQAGLARLDTVVEQMRALAPTVDDASAACRRRHPVGGWLNAQQWFQMTEMHMRHHLRQIDRLL